MSNVAFLTDVISAGLTHRLLTPQDILTHASPAVLATHLPRPLWSKLLAASLAAPAVGAILIVETIGVAQLCEHVPAPYLFAAVSDAVNRAGVATGQVVSQVAASSTSVGPMEPAGMAAPVVAASAAGPAAVGSETEDFGSLAAELSEAVDESVLDAAPPKRTRPGGFTRQNQARKPQSYAAEPAASVAAVSREANAARDPAPADDVIGDADVAEEDQLVEWTPGA